MTNIDILIADYDIEYCDLLAEHLSDDKEFNIQSILHNGKEVLKYLENNNNPDLLILDLVLPHLDGIGVLEELNQNNLINDMKIIVLTAMGHDKIMKTVFDLGVHYYIMKPFDLNRLKKRIKQIIYENNNLLSNIHLEAKLEIESGNFTPMVTQIIQELGIPAHIKGYRYVRQAVELVIENMDLLSAVTKELYPQVADYFNSTPSRVERAIRHAIDVAWQRGNQKALKEYFKNNLSENMKPSNSQFIAKIADKIMVDYKVS